MLTRLSAAVSGVDCLCPCPVANCLSAPLSNQLSSRVPLTTSGHTEISSPKPFVCFRAKTDKGIVCLADHLHSVTVVFFSFLRNLDDNYSIAPCAPSISNENLTSFFFLICSNDLKVFQSTDFLELKTRQLNRCSTLETIKKQNNRRIRKYPVLFFDGPGLWSNELSICQWFESPGSIPGRIIPKTSKNGT